MNKQDLISLLEILSQWEAFVISSKHEVPKQISDLKINLEKEILKSNIVSNQIFKR